MGIMDNAKDAAETAGRKIKDSFEDTADRVDDKVDEMKAESDVRKAESERDAVKTKNEANERMRGDD